MKALKHLLLPTTLAVSLLAPLSALASTQDDILTALSAYHVNDINKLTRIAQNMPSDPLKIYPSYWLTLKALDRGDETSASRFLQQNGPSVLTEKIRREWLKKLGKEQSWRLFEAQWNLLPVEGRDEESQCYGDLLGLRQGRAPFNLDRFLQSRPLPEGCNSLINASAQRGLISQDWLWQRLRLLLAGNYATQARQLAQTNGLAFDASQINSPGKVSPATRQGQEIILFSIENKARTSPEMAASALSAAQDAIGPSAAGFGWGQLALVAARKQQMSNALQWFALADKQQLSKEQWEWWARAALRQGQWSSLQNIIQAMPADLAMKPAWKYWLARALLAEDHPAAANTLLAQASVDRSYYGLLSLQELGNTMSTSPERAPTSAQDSTAIEQDPAVVRALALYDIAENTRKPELRSAAQSEWRWAMRNRSDAQLIAAAEIARNVGFYDMAIYSAERTKTQHDFSLRYLTPYKEVTQRYARQLNIDDAWVYGLIRQESRFIPVARSGVGASGLMQLMPSTARWVAKKMGLSNQLAVNDIDTNIQLGTWYLKYVLDSLHDNPVLATAAYNAGPSRARAWQAATPLEGTIYAETIPFSETRDYVQKVMANAAYYASAMGHGSLTLRNRMGTIPAKGS